MAAGQRVIGDVARVTCAMDFLSLTRAKPAWPACFSPVSFPPRCCPAARKRCCSRCCWLHPEQTLPALLLATLGNTLGGMTTYWMGRLLPQKLGAGATAKSAAGADGTAPPALLLAWAPIVGDALCAAAGWLRLHWLPCALWMAAGQSARATASSPGRPEPDQLATTISGLRP